MCPSEGKVSKLSSKYKEILKVVELYTYSRKDIGNLGERVVCEYLRRLGFSITHCNVATKTGELDVVAKKDDCLHIVEVKAGKCHEFPSPASFEVFNPAQNLHRHKIQKVVRTSEWFMANIAWEGEWQVDGAVVWLRERDGRAKIQYYPQIV